MNGVSFVFSNMHYNLFSIEGLTIWDPALCSIGEFHERLRAPVNSAYGMLAYCNLPELTPDFGRGARMSDLSTNILENGCQLLPFRNVYGRWRRCYDRPILCKSILQGKASRKVPGSNRILSPLHRKTTTPSCQIKTDLTTKELLTFYILRMLT